MPCCCMFWQAAPLLSRLFAASCRGGDCGACKGHREAKRPACNPRCSSLCPSVPSAEHHTAHPSLQAVPQAAAGRRGQRSQHVPPPPRARCTCSRMLLRLHCVLVSSPTTAAHFRQCRASRRSGMAAGRPAPLASSRNRPATSFRTTSPRSTTWVSVRSIVCAQLARAPRRRRRRRQSPPPVACRLPTLAAAHARRHAGSLRHRLQRQDGGALPMLLLSMLLLLLLSRRRCPHAPCPPPLVRPFTDS